ncbi:MAG TPA: hypothetical protein VGO59_20015 [Verrucomicrobiae bacterium]|jgi:hypothetical protein
MQLMLLGLSAAAILLAGCGKPVTALDLAGTWMPQAASRKWLATTNDCRIVLQSNDAFKASAPERLLEISDQAAGKTISGNGTWTLERKSKLELDYDVVILHFNIIDGKEASFLCNKLLVQGPKDNMKLFFYVEEEGGPRFVFERRPEQAISLDGGK